MPKAISKPERAGGNRLDVIGGEAFAHFHDGALAELLFDLGQGGLQGLALVVVHVLCPSKVNSIMAWMAQFLRYLAGVSRRRSGAAAREGVDHRLAADGLAIAGEDLHLRFGYRAGSTPGKAYGPHWLTR
jgi:hypothetical protein